MYGTIRNVAIRDIDPGGHPGLIFQRTSAQMVALLQARRADDSERREKLMSKLVDIVGPERAIRLLDIVKELDGVSCGYDEETTHALNLADSIALQDHFTREVKLTEDMFADEGDLARVMTIPHGMLRLAMQSEPVFVEERFHFHEPIPAGLGRHGTFMPGRRRRRGGLGQFVGMDRGVTDYASEAPMSLDGLFTEYEE